MGILDGVGKFAKGLQDALNFDVSTAGSLGSVAIPGEATLELPAGRIWITYEHMGDDQGFRKSEKWDGGPNVKLAIYRERDDAPMKIDVSGGNSMRQRKGKPSRSVRGSFQISAPGRYRMSAPHAIDDCYLEPKMLFDRARNSGAAGV